MQKQKLVKECPLYNTIDAFRLIDESGVGKVSPGDIVNFLNSTFGNDIGYDTDQLSLFVQRFDKNDRQSIKYSEFCSAFAP